MKTPYGKECPYFYGDYFRGREKEECRLLNKPSAKYAWTPDLCKNCPVPDIVQANTCPNMILQGEITSFFFKKKVKITAYCTKSHAEVKEPKVGCGLCHDLPQDVVITDL